jgi:hypothetical protein
MVAEPSTESADVLGSTLPSARLPAEALAGCADATSWTEQDARDCGPRQGGGSTPVERARRQPFRRP